MVFLSITLVGLDEALRTASKCGAAVWCGADAISEVDFNKSAAGGLTRFSYALGNRDAEVLADAINTIEQHHPGEVVWVEAAREP